MKMIGALNSLVGILFCICSSYQVFFMIVPFLWKNRPHRETVLHNFAVLISARNEEAVISELIESIKAQDYPAERIKVFVVADNCTDSTARIARIAGAEVIERFDKSRVGKGYALDYLLGYIKEQYGNDVFDAYLVFDADNLLDESYVTNINRTFSDGYEVITSCRNTKNYGDNWISSAYGIWFLRDSHFMNNSRMLLGSSSIVSGTGFMFSQRIMDKNGGWKFFTISEDTEFTCNNITGGIKVGYCGDAVFYDEQPTDFRQSCRQRMRWARGYLQVIKLYGGSLIKNALRGNFAALDIIMCIMPPVILMILSMVVNAVGLFMGIFYLKDITVIVNAGLYGILNSYLMFFVIGLTTVTTMWRSIHCSAVKKVISCFTLPLFMLTYMPVSLIALFQKPEWKPITHSVSVSLGEVRTNRKTPVKEKV